MIPLGIKRPTLIVDVEGDVPMFSKLTEPQQEMFLWWCLDTQPKGIRIDDEPDQAYTDIILLTGEDADEGECEPDEVVGIETLLDQWWDDSPHDPGFSKPWVVHTVVS